MKKITRDALSNLRNIAPTDEKRYQKIFFLMVLREEKSPNNCLLVEVCNGEATIIDIDENVDTIYLKDLIKYNYSYDFFDDLEDCSKIELTVSVASLKHIIKNCLK